MQYFTAIQNLLELGFIRYTEYDIFIIGIKFEDSWLWYKVHVLIIPYYIFLPVTIYQLVVVDWKDGRCSTTIICVGYLVFILQTRVVRNEPMETICETAKSLASLLKKSTFDSIQMKAMHYISGIKF